MTISVLIAAYNCSKTIGRSIESVLEQTASPCEILVADDGSEDETRAVVASYGPRVCLLARNHEGIANTRNALCEAASGEMLAFLDADDIWHPQYLEVQRQRLQEYPRAVASFTGHVNFRGHQDWVWKEGIARETGDHRQIPGPVFFEEYNRSAGLFASMSFCCVPRWVLQQIGRKAFDAAGAEDSYFFYLISLHGPVLYSKAELVAYRILDNSLSSDRTKALAARVRALEYLRPLYEASGRNSTQKVFAAAYSAALRAHARWLIGGADLASGRRQLRNSIRGQAGPVSCAKSMLLYLGSYAPSLSKKAWPRNYSRGIDS